jgi:hypothetical protein
VVLAQAGAAPACLAVAQARAAVACWAGTAPSPRAVAHRAAVRACLVQRRLEHLRAEHPSGQVAQGCSAARVAPAVGQGARGCSVAAVDQARAAPGRAPAAGDGASRSCREASAAARPGVVQDAGAARSRAGAATGARPRLPAVAGPAAARSAAGGAVTGRVGHRPPGPLSAVARGSWRAWGCLPAVVRTATPAGVRSGPGAAASSSARGTGRARPARALRPVSSAGPRREWRLSAAAGSGRTGGDSRAGDRWDSCRAARAMAAGHSGATPAGRAMRPGPSRR